MFKFLEGFIDWIEERIKGCSVLWQAQNWATAIYKRMGTKITVPRQFRTNEYREEQIVFNKKVNLI